MIGVYIYHVIVIFFFYFLYHFSVTFTSTYARKWTFHLKKFDISNIFNINILILYNIIKIIIYNKTNYWPTQAPICIFILSKRSMIILYNWCTFSAKWFIFHTIEVDIGYYIIGVWFIWWQESIEFGINDNNDQIFLSLELFFCMPTLLEIKKNCVQSIVDVVSHDLLLSCL